MAIYEITITGHYFSQLIVNRWNYVSTGTASGVSGSAALASAFGVTVDQDPLNTDTIIGMWASIVSNQYSFSSCFVRDLYAVDNFLDIPFVPALTGAFIGEALTPVMALGFNTNRTRLDVRAGQKRLVGVPELAVNSGGTLVGTYNTYMAALAGLMSETLSYPAAVPTIDFSPAILGLEGTPVVGAVPPRKTYARWEDEADQLAHTAVGVTWEGKGEVRSQTSRQYGRGA